jgi:hypothetical protein
VTKFHQVLSGINVSPLLSQLRANPQLWETNSEWTRNKVGSSIYHTENIVLRFNKSSLPGLNDWNRPAFSILSAAQQIVFDLMRAIPGEHLGKVIITRLAPGETIDWHIDQMPPGIPPYFERYQIPLHVAPKVRFVVGDEALYMEPGTAWWFDNQTMHAVFNDSDEDRISMLTDIRPFKLIQSGT